MVTLLGCFCLSGAQCSQIVAPTFPPIPQVYYTPPLLGQLIQTVNENTQKVTQLHTQGATISSPSLPMSLSAEMAMERPHRFRMRASTSFTGPELDLGVNDERFWVWLKRSQVPQTYFARHSEFQTTQMQKIMPVKPQWLLEAMGLVYLDPSGSYQGPITRPDGNYELRANIQGTDGSLTKVYVIDWRFATVLEQHVYDDRGQLLASVIAGEHRLYPLWKVHLPHRLEIVLPPAQMDFELNVVSYSVNQLLMPPEQLWAMPQIPGYPAVDLARTHLGPTLPSNSSIEPYRGIPGASAVQQPPLNDSGWHGTGL